MHPDTFAAAAVCLHNSCILHTLACVHTCSLTPGVLFRVLRSSVMGMATGYNFTELKKIN